MKLVHGPLENAFVRLAPLAPTHRDALIAAGEDASIFKHYSNAALAEGGVGAFVDFQLAEAAQGKALPYVVEFDGAIVGQTCFLNPRPSDGGVEIGSTWYAPRAQGGVVNPAAKMLMLGHAFSCGAERVELKTDALNARSRAAILKLGAAFEGIHRHHMRRPDGTWRDTAWYSILRDEWPTVQARLTERLRGERD